MTDPSPAELEALAALHPDVLAVRLDALAAEHGAAALPTLTALAAHRDRGVRRAAKRALYRLEQRGVVAPAAPPAPLLAGGAPRPVQAWVSGVDGSGSRTAWIVFERDYGALSLCSVMLNDTVGILDAAGGDVTRKRLDRELQALRASQKLPWVETDPARAVGLVVEALVLNRTLGTSPPAAFVRWERFIPSAPPSAPLSAPAVDEALVARSAQLLDLPEMASWFLEPASVQADALELLQARESRLVVSEQIRAERRVAIVANVVEREIDGTARRLWARRLLEMGLVFEAVERAQHAALARGAAAALLDETRDARRIPFTLALASRALDIAGEVALGRLSAEEASRRPVARRLRG